MNKTEKKLLTYGLDCLSKSYDKEQKKLAKKYIKHNLDEVIEVLDDLSDKSLINVMQVHKNSFRAWALKNKGKTEG